MRGDLENANREVEDLRARLAESEAARENLVSRRAAEFENSRRTTTSAVVESNPETQIALLMALAEKQVAAKHLTLPESGNALLTYKEILRIAPNHEVARSRIQWIAAQFRRWAVAAMERGDRTKALFYYQRLLVVGPNDTAAREALLGLIEPGGNDISPPENPSVAVPQKSVWELESTNEPASLFAAVTQGNLRALDRALNAGLPVDARAEDGSTPLFTATRAGAKSMVVELIHRGARVNARDYDGDSPLSVSARRGSVDIAQTLIAEGADVNLRNYDGKTPLMEAAWHGHADVALELVFQGAEINATDDAGRSALLHAVSNGRLDVAQALLVHGANVNVRNGEGWTALMSAANNGDAATVRALVDHGADVHAANETGTTALMIAENGEFADVAKILRGESR